MTVHLITFASRNMSRSQEQCEASANRHGVDVFFSWGENDLRETEWYKNHEGLLSQPRGCGYWAWKPWLILAELAFRAQPNDVVIYSDAGIEFIAPVSHVIDRMDQDIFLFGNNWEHAHWCKRDVIEAVWPWWERGRMLDMDGDREVFVFSRFHKDNGEQHWINVRQLAWERFHKQVQASVILFRVSDYTRKFVKEWLDWCLFEGGRLIDDSPSRLPNHPEFREHRHDQSILTTLAYREGIKLHWWGARYNMDQPGGGFVYPKAPEFAGDNYEPFVHHHRRRNHEWEQVA